MFDFVHKNQKVLHIFLGVIMVAFTFWGVQSYKSGGGDGVANVDGQSISPSEYDAALRNAQERMRQQLGQNFDASMLDNPELRLSVLDNLIEQKLLSNQAKRIGIAVSDQELVSFIGKIGAFQDNGAFSRQKYEAALQGQGMTPVMFESRLREDLMREHLLDPVSQDLFTSSAEAEQIQAILGEGREYALFTVKPEEFLAAQKVDDAAIKSYYDKHSDEFKVPEQVRVEYLVLSPDQLASSVDVSEDEANKYYQAHKDSEFSSKEERQASHILIAVKKGAPAADVEKAKSLADRLDAELKKSPGKFAEYAKKYSEDPGSAQSGGDLGFFGRGMMVKPFEDAVFAMKPNEVSDVVKSDFGFHIIKLTAVKPAKVESYQEAHDRVVHELKQQKAGKKFAEVAENFSNMVYEQSDSLKPAAAAFNVQIRQSGWLTKSGGDPVFPQNPKLLQAIFSSDVLQQKRNTEAVEVSPNTLVSARLLEMKPAYTRTLAEVGPQIEKTLKMDGARAAAKKAGEEKLKSLQAGGAGVTFGEKQTVTRQNARTLGPEVAAAVFKAAKFPAYAGVETPEGYTLVEVLKATQTPADPSSLKGIGNQLQQTIAREELNAYFQGLKASAKVSINQKLLAKNP